MTATDLESGAPPTQRLVIRINLGPESRPVPPVQRRANRRPLLIVGAVALAVVLSWIGISIFRTEPASAPGQVTPVSSESAAKPALVEAAPSSTAEPSESQARQAPDAPITSTHEVIPDVPRSARNTIRGTIKVSVRVIVAKEGSVLTATADDPGPSRYFERLAIEAAKQWTFTRAESAEERSVRVQFYFKRSGTTAEASPIPQ